MCAPAGRQLLLSDNRPWWENTRGWLWLQASVQVDLFNRSAFTGLPAAFLSVPRIILKQTSCQLNKSLEEEPFTPRVSCTWGQSAVSSHKCLWQPLIIEERAHVSGGGRSGTPRPRTLSVESLTLYQESGAPGLFLLLSQCRRSWSRECWKLQLWVLRQDNWTRWQDRVLSSAQTRQSRGQLSDQEKSNFPNTLFCGMAEGWTTEGSVFGNIIQRRDRERQRQEERGETEIEELSFNDNMF